MSESATTIALIKQSLNIDSHYHLLHWLQGEVQTFLPHDILITAWGDFSLGIYYLDVVAIHPLLRTVNIDKEKLRPHISAMLELWQDSAMNPVILNIEDGYFDIHNALTAEAKHEKTQNQHVKEFKTMSSCLIHGIQDQRAHDDCLYLFLSSESIPQSSKQDLPIFLPFIDNALRRIEPFKNIAMDGSYTEEEKLNPTLSNRECEIMNLVKDGKTNIEISEALDISKFTVKNHLQTIFKKLKATNRSQASFNYKTSMK